MKIVWDEPKRVANLAKHGLDFADIDEAFFASATIVSARHNRLIAVGTQVAGIIVVVFATLGEEGVSIISMRRASRRERALIYE